MSVDKRKHQAGIQALQSEKQKFKSSSIFTTYVTKQIIQLPKHVSLKMAIITAHTSYEATYNTYTASTVSGT